MAIADLRREYNFAGLRRRDLEPNPIEQFRKWFQQITEARAISRFRKRLIRWYKKLLLMAGAESLDVNAMTLATVDREGRPSARIVLLKGLDERGFIFFTNYGSRKGVELAGNPSASLVFYWPEQERQVCVFGTATKLPRAESEAYFKSRPRGSQIAAWASHQSQPVATRAALEAAWKQAEQSYPAELPIPPNWGGYVLAPERMEFWQGRPNRLHDRFQYTRQADGTWRIERLCP